MFGDHGLCGLLEEGAHEKSPKCLDGNLGDFGEFCKGLHWRMVAGRFVVFRGYGDMECLRRQLEYLRFC